VTDSGCNTVGVRPALESDGDGVGMGLADGVGETPADGLIAWVVGVVAGWLLHPASMRTATHPTRRIEAVMTGQRSFTMLCSGLR
jgi:hypothetical protein